MSDKFRTFAMSYFCSFPPKVTIPRCSEEFLFPSTKIQNIYYTDNQLVAFLRLFRDYPYLLYGKISLDSNESINSKIPLRKCVHILVYILF